MMVVEDIAATLADLLREDRRRVLLGEDVADGGMLGWSKVAAADPELAHQILPLPLVPSTLLSHAAGLALAGARPIVLMPAVGDLLEGLAALRELCRLPERLSGELPVLILAPSGPGFGLGGAATEGVERILAAVDGVRVAMLGIPSEASAVVRAAAEFWAGTEPTVLLVPRRACFRTIDAPTGEPRVLSRAFAGPHVVRAGDAVSIYAWGTGVELALRAVDRAGVDGRVIDVEAVVPLPRAALLEHVVPGGRVVVVHEGPSAGGVGAELAAVLAEQAVFWLDAPVHRLCGAPATRDEALALPSIDALVTVLTEVARGGAS